MNMFYLTAIQLLCVLISGVVLMPNIEIRDSYRSQSKALRVGYCQFDEQEHTSCYVCARLYSSLELYKDCCHRTDMMMVQVCQKLRR